MKLKDLKNVLTRLEPVLIIGEGIKLEAFWEVDWNLIEPYQDAKVVRISTINNRIGIEVE